MAAHSRVPAAPSASPEERLAALGVALPSAAEPLGAYVPTRLVGDLLYTSGVLPMDGGVLERAGAVGPGGLTVDEGAAAARLCAVNVLALLRHRLGSLDVVRQVIQISGFVRGHSGFAEQPAVLNGASELFFQVFGEAGRHTRMALGTTDLPLGAPVEISAIVRIYPDLLDRRAG